MPIRKTKIYKIFRRVIVVALILLALFSLVALYINYKYKPQLTDQIKTLVKQSTDGLYSIEFTDVTANILTLNASIRGVKIVADTIRFAELVRLKLAPNNLYNIQVKKLLIKNFHPLALIRNRKLNINSLILDKPEVVMVNRQFDFNEDRPPRPIQSPYDFISNTLKAFSIKTIRFNNASFKYVNNNLAQPKSLAISKVDIILKDLLIDSTSLEDPKRIYVLKDVELNLTDYSYLTPNKLYTIKLNKLAFKASTAKLNIKKLELVPMYPEMEFAKAVGRNVDRYAVHVNNIDFTGLDLPLYVRRQIFKSKELSISNGSVSVFNDNSIKNKFKSINTNTFPHQMLQELSLPIEIKKILFKNIGVIYSAYSPISKQKGMLSFERTGGVISNFTNIANVKTKDSILTAHLESYLMGQGKLDLNLKFSLNAKNGDFSYAGLLHNVNARVINRITKPLGLLQINKGYVDKLAFNFRADNTQSVGKVDFRYYDLSVGLMRSDQENGILIKKGLTSFLANALMINASNPNADGKFVSAKVIYSRVENATFFNQIWRSLLEGIKHSVGLTAVKQTKMAEHIANFKEIRESRKKRKAIRIKRRLENRKQDTD